MSISTPSVVERASKEISRRMHSLGFNRSSSKESSSAASSSGQASSPGGATASSAVAAPTTTSTSVASAAPSPSKKLVLSESDKLNGNSENPEPCFTDGASAGGSAPEATTLPSPGSGSASSTCTGGPPPPPASSSSAVLRKKPVCAAAKQPAARASMGSIIKGSVMDKVSNVFNNGVNMGNSNSSSANNSLQSRKQSKESAATASIPEANAAVVTSVTAAASSNDPKRNSSSNSGTTGITTAPSGVNIPKGAVANGRAKFETTPKVSPDKPIEKPSRFFGSRSRTNSPMLPVKTPKVPTTSASKDLKNGNNGDNKKDSSKVDDQANKESLDPLSLSSTVGKNTTNNSPSINAQAKSSAASTLTSSKLASKLKKRFTTWEELWQDSKFLYGFFSLFPNQNERAILAQVCQKWREVLYQPVFWRDVRPVIHCRAIRSWSTSVASYCTNTSSSTATSSASNQSITNSSFSNNEIRSTITCEVNSNNTTTNNTTNNAIAATDMQQTTTSEAVVTSPASTTGSTSGGEQMKLNFFNSLKLRGFDTICLLNANDTDIFDFIQNFPHGATGLQSLILRCCNISDRGLEAIMEFLQGLYKLEIAGCNEITEQGLWSSLHPRLASLTINDCINVADECVCAVTQLLPALFEFNLQAYHVTDSALSYFSPKQTGTLNILRLQSCWEITNHGIVNIVHTLPNLTVLSLSGCSKITDDGIELIAENLRKLRSLDLSWCPRVTDAALEYIACDLNHLEELTLDRCVHITDIGIGYISTMLALHTLYLRWCTQIRDFGLQHICGMRSMQILSLAGCPLLTSTGMSNLIQLRHLQELELTNCPGATADLIEYLRQNLPKCLVLD